MVKLSSTFLLSLLLRRAEERENLFYATCLYRAVTYQLHSPVLGKKVGLDWAGTLTVAS